MRQPFDYFERIDNSDEQAKNLLLIDHGSSQNSQRSHHEKLPEIAVRNRVRIQDEVDSRVSELVKDRSMDEQLLKR